MTFKPKLPAFLSRTPDPAGETILVRSTPMEPDEPASKGTVPLSLAFLQRYPITQQLQILGGCLVLVMLFIAVTVYRDSRQATYNTAYIATAGEMRMLSQRLARLRAWPCWASPWPSSNWQNRVKVSPATSTA